ncbi:MAG: hypothetical protein ACI8PZ_006878 [Myxococcota bacterium]|jgi:uncharacterized protein (TIGR03382 family)
MFAVLSLVALLAAPAQAFAPHDHVHQGIEPQRIHHVTPARQAELKRTDAWKAFVRAEGDGWDARFDEVTGTPLRLWGPGVDIGPLTEARDVERAVVHWLDRHAELLGHTPGTLVPLNAVRVERSDAWYLNFEAPVDGLPVWRGGVVARVKNGRITMVGSRAYANTRIEGDISNSSAIATQSAISGGSAPHANHTDVVAEPWMLPVEDIRGLRLVPTWMVRSRTVDPPGMWVTFVHGETGEVLNTHNEVRFIDGQVTGEHEPRTLNGAPLVEFPMVDMAVTTGPEFATTDSNGEYSISEGDHYTAEFIGEYLEIRNEQGGDSVLSESGPDLHWTASDASESEISVWAWLHEIRDWGEVHAPEVSMVTDDLLAYVNINDSCNAFYDGNVNFFRSGGDCNNTGRISDVVYHEWGHGFHWTSFSGRYVDGSLGEGVADTVAFLQTDDTTIAPYFYDNGSGIRDVGADQAYPIDFIADPAYVHSNGLIFGGSMWDLWGLLRSELGEVEGTTATTNIFTGLIKGAGGIPDTFDEAMFADDDDGDLSNGTPHLCDLIDAFGRHGLGPVGTGSFFVPGHEQVVMADPGQDHAVVLNPQSAAPECVGYVVNSADLTWRASGGEWNTQSLTVNATIEGSIPEQSYGTFVEYYVTLDTEEGEVSAPSGGYINPYSFYVGGVLELRCDDFEDDSGDYTHRLVSGEEAEGADDWQWGHPLGVGGDPGFAHSGEFVWGNDLGADNFNGQYQPDKENQLRSPKLQYSEHYSGVFLQYWRWLHVEDGYYDRAWIEADNDEVWRNHTTVQDIGNEHHLENEWVSHSVDLQGLGDDGDLRLTWNIASDGGLEFGGWTIDDVCVFAPATADNRLGITDFNASTTSAGVEFSWTNPVHDPVRSVRVVRNDTRYPEHEDDGVIVFETDAAIAGGKATATEPGRFNGTGYYAVFASDGTEWLGWSVEGWNADNAEGLGGAPGAGAGAGDGSTDLEASGGCGCTTNASSLAGWPLLIALAGLARRRA